VPRTRTDQPATPADRALRDLSRTVHDCRACALHGGRTKAVIGTGPSDARLVIVGFAPRRHEDLQGIPLAGAARNVLTNALLDVGLDPAAVRITSLVRCRPPDDRAPARAEVAPCAGHLQAELAIVAPEVVVTLGAVPTAALLGRPVPLERVAGYRLDVLQGVTLIPTYHPADAVRGVPQAGPALRRDLAVAKAVLEGRMASGAQALAELRARLATDQPPAAS
jgi:uracil-DNA glycosylase